MSKLPPVGEQLPGLESASTAQGPAMAPVIAARSRVKPVDRSQLTWQMLDVERLIEPEHSARAIWELAGRLNLDGFYAPIEAVEGTAGRTPWDPRLLVSLWIYAYSRGISSAREIARRCTYEPAFQWLCGLGEINHHTLSDFRSNHNGSLGELFVQVLGVLSAEGLVSLERVMHDGTKVKACAKGDSFRREQRLGEHLEAARQLVQSLEQNANEQPSRQQAAQQRAARERQQRLEQALVELAKVRQAKRDAAEKDSARASTSDPEARVMKQADGGYAPSYNVQMSTEASHKIIVAVGLSQSSSDGAELLGGVSRIEQNLKVQPKQLVVDGGFTSRQNIMETAARGIDLIGSWGEPKGGNTSGQALAPEFQAQAFTYDAAHDQYHCPAGNYLPLVYQYQGIGVVQHQYRADRSVCQACRFKPQCCPRSTQGRSIARSVDAPDVHQFREKMQTPQAQQIYAQRAPVAEFPNAWIKEKLGLRQFRLRGLLKVGCEALWACLTYNVQQWIRLCWRLNRTEQTA